MTLTDNARLVEAILFLENEPLTVEHIGKITGLSDKDISDALSEISESYYEDNHGLALVENAESYSFVPVSSLNDKLRHTITSPFWARKTLLRTLLWMWSEVCARTTTSSP